MDYLLENWGSFVGVLGLLASIGGLVYALLARRAARSAEQAAREARQALSRSLSSVDIERAVELINRLKNLHRQRDWSQAISLYQILRRTLTEIRASMPAGFEQARKAIDGAIPEITAMENQIGRSLHENSELEDTPRFDATLNTIQQELEMLQSNITYLDGAGGC